MFSMTKKSFPYKQEATDTVIRESLVSDNESDTEYEKEKTTCPMCFDEGFSSAPLGHCPDCYDEHKKTLGALAITVHLPPMSQIKNQDEFDLMTKGERDDFIVAIINDFKEDIAEEVRDMFWERFGDAIQHAVGHKSKEEQEKFGDALRHVMDDITQSANNPLCGGITVEIGGDEDTDDEDNE